VLQVGGDLVLAPAVEARRYGIDVEEAAHKNGHKSAHDVGRVKVMLGEGEHGNT